MQSHTSTQTTLQHGQLPGSLQQSLKVCHPYSHTAGQGKHLRPARAFGAGTQESAPGILQRFKVSLRGKGEDLRSEAPSVLRLQQRGAICSPAPRSPGSGPGLLAVPRPHTRLPGLFNPLSAGTKCPSSAEPGAERTESRAALAQRGGLSPQDGADGAVPNPPCPGTERTLAALAAGPGPAAASTWHRAGRHCPDKPTLPGSGSSGAPQLRDRKGYQHSLSFQSAAFLKRFVLLKSPHLQPRLAHLYF